MQLHVCRELTVSIAFVGDSVVAEPTLHLSAARWACSAKVHVEGAPWRSFVVMACSCFMPDCSACFPASKSSSTVCFCLQPECGHCQGRQVSAQGAAEGPGGSSSESEESANSEPELCGSSQSEDSEAEQIGGQNQSLSCACYQPGCGLCVQSGQPAGLPRPKPWNHGQVKRKLVASSRPKPRNDGSSEPELRGSSESEGREAERTGGRNQSLSCACYQPGCGLCMQSGQPAALPSPKPRNRGQVKRRLVASSRPMPRNDGRVKRKLAQDIEEDASLPVDVPSEHADVVGRVAKIAHFPMTALQYIGRQAKEKWLFWELFGGCCVLTGVVFAVLHDSASPWAMGRPVDNLVSAGRCCAGMVSPLLCET
jgi:hypothetical protein